MKRTGTIHDVATAVSRFVKRDFTPHFGQLQAGFASNPLWLRMRQLGSQLWLDTGDIDSAGQLWTREFSALTTNNTLLNREVQKGTYDALIVQARQLLDSFEDMTDRRRTLEMAFILNATHALRLVERFDAYVSVEEHTALAHDLPAAVAYAHRYYEICPERFIVKIPFTPTGLLATRRLMADGVPINHTLGFSARQNYVIARIAQPQYANVFLGRLNSFVADNRLGDGTYVGEKATLASQEVIRRLRQEYYVPTRQIGASFRAGGQVGGLAGIDVMTVPPKVAQEFLDSGLAVEEVFNRTGEKYHPRLNAGVDAASIRLDTLWDVGEEVIACVDALMQENLDHFTGDDLVRFFAQHDCGDLLVQWRPEQIRTSREEGKIPKLDNWREPLKSGRIGLDSLMNLAGLNSFTADQDAMDQRIETVAAGK